MCDECHQSPHATMCPNGTPMVDEYLVDCALCGAEVDEETTIYGICEKCWTDAHTFHNAVKYGRTETEFVYIHGLYAKILTEDQIEMALQNAVLQIGASYSDFVVREANEFLNENSGDFADWLKAQKGNE